MDRVFLQILHMSLTASIAILFVLLARLILKSAPKVFSYALWSVVLFRLVCPFSFESVLSLVPQQIPAQPIYENYPLLNKDVSFGSAATAALEAVADAANGGLGLITIYLEPEIEGEMNVTFALHYEVWILFGKYVWAFGIVALLIYSGVSLLRLRSRLVGSVKWRDNIYFADHIPSPFVLGIIRPKIYLPSALSGKEREYILLHEQTHIRRFDYIFKIAAFFALVVHWFNPLVWLAYILFIRDMEMSCDESVMRHMDTDIRGRYSASLLSLATGRKIIVGTPLAFGEGDTKSRIKNVMNYKKPTLWILVAATIIVSAVTIGSAANRANREVNAYFPPLIPLLVATETIDGAQITAKTLGYSYDGKSSLFADGTAPWEVIYGNENTLVIDGEMGQNFISLDAEKPTDLSYMIYLPDGTVYDDGTRRMHRCAYGITTANTAS